MRSFLLLVLCIFFGNMVLFAQNNKGIGISFSKNDTTGVVTVLTVNEGNAAADAGMRVADELVNIGSINLSKLKRDEVITLLKGGAEGTRYTITVKRKIQTTLGEKIKELELQVTPREVVAQACLSGDCKNGTGILVDNATGMRSEGEFINGELVKGKTYYKSGRIWREGVFKAGKLDGKNCVEYYDQTNGQIRLKGFLVAGKIREGIFNTADGNVTLDGSFDEEQRVNGYIKTKSPGFYYEGTCVHGTYTGKAETMSWDGGRYSGPVTNSKPDGKGVLKIGKTTYKGTWRNGNREGKFRVIDKMGGTFESVHHYSNGVRIR